jgi:hypothetical protein
MTAQKKKPLPAHVLKKFKEQNAQTSFLAQVRQIISEFDAQLESQGEISSRRLSNCPDTVVEAVREHFRGKGWEVRVIRENNAHIFCVFVD